MSDPDTTVNGVSLLAALDRARPNAAASLLRTEDRVRRIFAAAALLEAAGVPSGLSEFSDYSLYLGDVGRDKLPLLRKVLGPMRVAGKEVKDARKRLLTVTVRFTDHPDVSAYYEKRMPRRRKGEPDAVRCRIVRNVRVEHVLVCETGPR